MREADYFIDDLVYRSVRVQSRSAGVLRPGQCLFNTLCGLRRDLAHKVAGTNVDPFHADDRIPECLAWIRANYTQESL